MHHFPHGTAVQPSADACVGLSTLAAHDAAKPLAGGLR